MQRRLRPRPGMASIPAGDFTRRVLVIQVRRRARRTTGKKGGSMALTTLTKPERIAESLDRVMARDLRLMRRFSRDMEWLFDEFGFRPRFFERTLPEGGWMPDVEIFQRDNRLIVRADLPGLKKEDVKVHVEENTLVIEGERREESEVKREGLYRSERSYGSFYRGLPLPEGVKADQVDATFKDGVLEIAMPMEKTKAVKSIDVKVK